MRISLASAALLLVMSPTLFAHAGHGASGLLAGATHPIHGFDHLLAMVAVGLLGVRCATGATGNRQALWLVPAAFMSSMVIGGLLAVAGVALPFAEWGIALSVLVFGVLVALGTVPRTWVACLVAGLFAILHGHAHVAEMEGGSLTAYMGGFLAITALLHAVGIGGGWMLATSFNQNSKQTPIRAVGGGVALISSVLFYGLIAG